MEQNKGLGGSLVDVFDAALNLIKTEARVQMTRVTDTIKSKGIGLVLLLSSLVPVTLGLIFLILFLFYAFMALGMAAWGAALSMALLSFVAAALLLVLGVSKLQGKAPVSEKYDEYDLSVPYTQQDEGSYGTVTGSQVMSSEYRGDARVGDLRVDLQGQPRRAAERYGYAPESAYGEAGSRYAGGHSRQAGGHSTSTKGTSSDAPGIPVSTTPTYKEDMQKEGY